MKNKCRFACIAVAGVTFQAGSAANDSATIMSASDVVGVADRLVGTYPSPLPYAAILRFFILGLIEHKDKT